MTSRTIDVAPFLQGSTPAPGGPGGAPRWTSSAKSGVGTALGASGRVWFTISHGILNEVYYPRLDQACTRDLGLIVTDGKAFLSEEKRHARHEIAPFNDGVPAFRLTNTCGQQRYRIEKEILADPRREVVLQRMCFTALEGVLSDYRLFALLAPHLGNCGAGNTAWVGEVKGRQMLFAERGGTALALACSAGWAKRSVGFVGVSDGWSDLSLHGGMEWCHGRAEDGNVALTGEIDLSVCAGTFVLALGFGRTFGEAGHRAIASLWDGFDRASSEYCSDWKEWQQTLKPLQVPPSGGRDLYRVSTAVLRTHESSRFPGGIIASLSIPWGFSKGDGDLGGYHLVWPRDLVESAGGLLAAGAPHNAWRVLRYLAVTQEADGHWPQNMWLDGTPYWSGVQMDETGFPILLVDLARRHGALDDAELGRLWPMVRRAAGFLARNGPVTQQDRWEEDPGYSPFTLAVEVAALLCAADLADVHEPLLAAYLRETADAWNSAIEHWTYVTGTELARKIGVDGYYVRIAPPEEADAASPSAGFVPIKNRAPGQSLEAAEHIVSPDAAHAEYIKLCRSLADGGVFDMPPQPVLRYQVQKQESPHAIWRFNHKCQTLLAGKRLRIEILQPARVHWSVDGWRTAVDSPTKDTGLGLHVADLPTDRVPPGGRIEFTFCWVLPARWEGRDFTVSVTVASRTPP